MQNLNLLKKCSWKKWSSLSFISFLLSFIFPTTFHRSFMWVFTKPSSCYKPDKWWKSCFFQLCFFLTSLLMSATVVKHVSCSLKWSASTGILHDNSVKRRVLHCRKSSAPLGKYFTSMFWKSERAVVEHLMQVTDDHQSILAWLAWGKAGWLGRV